MSTMKKIFLIVVMIFSFTCVFGQKKYSIKEAEFLKSCVDNNKQPHLSYIKSEYVYSPQINDFEEVNLSANETAYYKGLNKTYKELLKIKNYFNENEFTASTIQGYLNYESQYNYIRFTNKYKKQLNGGVTLVTIGATIIAGSEILLTHCNNNIVNRYKTIKTISWTAGGVMTIAGAILTVNAINKQNHLLAVNPNSISYTHKF